MFGSLKERLKKVLGSAKHEEPVQEMPVIEETKEQEVFVKPGVIEPKPEGKIIVKEKVETLEGTETLKIREPKEINDDELKSITPTSLPITEPVVITEEGERARQKMIEEYRHEDEMLKKKDIVIPEEVTKEEDYVRAVKPGVISVPRNETVTLLKQSDEEEARKFIDEEIEKEQETVKINETINEAEESDEGKIEKTGFLKRFKKAVTEKTLTEEDIEPIINELKNALLENDVALRVAEEICAHVKKQLIETSVPRSQVDDEIKRSLRSAMRVVMSQAAPNIERLIDSKPNNEPVLIVFLGFNGSGKTTTMAKIANRYLKYKPVFAAADTFRAASVEQVEKHAEILGLDVVKHQYGADPAAVIFDAVKHAKAVGSRLVLADTAGRLHENANLMDELKKIVRVNKPDLKILVLDALTGNDIYEQSRRFNEAVDVDAIILSKADVYKKGGAALSASHTIGKPIMFLGTGQQYDDIMAFDPDKVADELLG